MRPKSKALFPDHDFEVVQRGLKRAAPKRKNTETDELAAAAREFAKAVRRRMRGGSWQAFFDAKDRLHETAIKFAEARR